MSTHIVYLTNFRSDYHKLTYYYYADSYVNFNELVTDLFKQYKVRIWMSAVNPASVVNPATPTANKLWNKSGQTNARCLICAVSLRLSVLLPLSNPAVATLPCLSDQASVQAIRTFRA